MSFVSKSKTKFAPKIKRRLQTSTRLSSTNDVEQQNKDKIVPPQANDHLRSPKREGENVVANESPSLPTDSSGEPAASITANASLKYIDNSGESAASISPMITANENTSKTVSPMSTTSNNKILLPSKRRLSSISNNSSRRGSVKVEDTTLGLKNGIERSSSAENGGNDLIKKLKKKKKKKSSSLASVILLVPKFRNTFSDENRSNSNIRNSANHSRNSANPNINTATGLMSDRRNSNDLARSSTNGIRNELIGTAEREFDKAYDADLIYELIPSLIYKKRRQEKKKQIQKEMGLDENDKKFLTTNEEEIDFNKICLVLDPRTKQVRALKKVYHEIFKKKYPDMEFKITSYSQLPRHGVSLDEHLFKNFSIDEDSFSMSDLCVPSLPIGEVSQDYKLAKEGTKKLRLARLHQMNMRKEARKLGIPLDDLLNTGESLEEIQRRKEKVEELFQSHEEIPAATSALQLNLHGGEIVVDQDSQLIDTRENLNFSGRERTIENENPYENPIHSRSFSKYSYLDRWSLEETVRLYHALGTWGTDFGIIAGLFPHRTRRQIKKKFTLEEKKRLPLVEMALSKKLPPNLESYIQGFNLKKDISEKLTFKTIEEFNEVLEAEREKHTKELEIIKKEIEKSKENDREMIDKKKQDDDGSNEEVIGEIPLRDN